MDKVHKILWKQLQKIDRDVVGTLAVCERIDATPDTCLLNNNPIWAHAEIAKIFNGRNCVEWQCPVCGEWFFKGSLLTSPP